MLCVFVTSFQVFSSSRYSTRLSARRLARFCSRTRNSCLRSAATIRPEMHTLLLQPIICWCCMPAAILFKPSHLTAQCIHALPLYQRCSRNGETIKPEKQEQSETAYVCQEEYGLDPKSVSGYGLWIQLTSKIQRELPCSSFTFCPYTSVIKIFVKIDHSLRRHKPNCRKMPYLAI